MILFSEIAKLILNVLFFIHKIVPVKNRVSFISRQSDLPSLDIEMLAGRLNKDHPEIQVVSLCRKIPDGIVGKLAYCLHIAGPQLHALACSRVIILDGYCIPVSLLKHRKATTVIQMWHAMGSLKKFGRSIIDESEGSSKELAEAMGMHNNYDLFFASSKECLPHFSHAFGYPEDKGAVMPLPRLDYLKKNQLYYEKREEIFASGYADRNRTIILYAPTFRKNKTENDHTKELRSLIDEKKYQLITAHHPVSKLSVKNKYSALDLLSVSDILITDYSAVMFESAAAGIPTYLYTYDIDEYVDSRGFYIDFVNDVTLPRATSAEMIIQMIEKNECDPDTLKAFSDRFIADIPDVCGKICGILENKMEKESIY